MIEQIGCPNCQKQNPKIAKYCGYCGFAILEIEDSDLELLRAELEPKHFRLIKKLGQGGMATVYLAEQIKLERNVVIKILHAEYSHNQEIRERFLREARTEAKLRHQNIVEIIDMGVAEGRPYFIMEFGESGSLYDLLLRNKSGLSPKEATFFILKILKGLEVAHSKSIIHRDIKPENILIRENGEPFLVDFGIAKNSSDSMTQTGQLLGTVNYMSPEQCMGLTDIDNRTDIYSTGIMFYQLLVGETPFKGENPITIINKHISEKMPLLNADNIKLPNIDNNQIFIDAINEIIQKACQKDKSERYNSVSEMIKDISNLLKYNAEYPNSKHFKKKYIKPLLIGFFFIDIIIAGYFLNLYKDSIFKKSDQVKVTFEADSPWSNDLGKMTWEQAEKKCKENSFRLPDIDELKNAYDSKVTTSWINSGKDYWSLSVKNAEEAFYINIFYGFTYSTEKSNEFSVRCYRNRNNL